MKNKRNSSTMRSDGFPVEVRLRLPHSPHTRPSFLSCSLHDELVVVGSCFSESFLENDQTQSWSVSQKHRWPWAWRQASEVGCPVGLGPLPVGCAQRRSLVSTGLEGWSVMWKTHLWESAVFWEWKQTLAQFFLFSHMVLKESSRCPAGIPQ